MLKKIIVRNIHPRHFSHEEWKITYLSNGQYRIESVAPQTGLYIRGDRTNQRAKMSSIMDRSTIWIIEQVQGDIIQHLADLGTTFYLQDRAQLIFDQSLNVDWFDF